MVLYNYQDREITGKIVYFGPQNVGKATSLRCIYDRVDEDARGKLVTVATDEGRMLHFDFLPVNVGEITGMKIRFQLVTAPGPLQGESGWRRVLQGADAIVFVADSDPKGLAANREAYEHLMEQLENCGIDSDKIPLIFQINKRDLSVAVSVEQINQEINLRRVPWFASSASNGEGVLETFQTIGRMLLVDIGRRYKEELLRKKREQVQRTAVALGPAGSESADPEEETRAIRLNEMPADSQRAATLDEEAPTRIVEPEELEELEPAAEPRAAAARKEAVSEASAAAPAREASGTRPEAEEAPSSTGTEVAPGNGRPAGRTAEPAAEEHEESGVAAPKNETAPRTGRGAAASSQAGELRSLRSEIAQLGEQSLRLLETQAKLLRRVEELRQRLEQLAEEPRQARGD